MQDIIIFIYWNVKALARKYQKLAQVLTGKAEIQTQVWLPIPYAWRLPFIDN